MQVERIALFIQAIWYLPTLFDSSLRFQHRFTPPSIHEINNYTCHQSTIGTIAAENRDLTPTNVKLQICEVKIIKRIHLVTTRSAANMRCFCVVALELRSHGEEIPKVIDVLAAFSARRAMKAAAAW